MLLTADELEAPLLELAAIEAEQKRRRFLHDPAYWAQVRLGVHLWSGQRKIFDSVRLNRRTAVQSCHEIGKSFSAGLLVAWWIDAHAPGEAFVVTSAPTNPQIKAILWREIGRVHAKGQLAGRVNQTEWFITMPDGNEELVAFGRKPNDYEPTAFQGIHAKHVLYVFDEACGIPASLYDAADSLIANDYSKALIIGNPDDPNTEFAEHCKPGSGWNVIAIGAFDSPNFTGEPIPEDLKHLLIGHTYVEEKRKKWAPNWVWTEDGKRCVPPPGAKAEDTNPLWQSKVLGKFPANADGGGLIPLAWIRDAQYRTLEPVGPHRLGVDVGGGGDSSTIAEARGPVVRIKSEDHNPDTMQTCGNVIAMLHKTGAHTARVDMVGIGRGVVDRGKEQDYPFVGINVGSSPYMFKDEDEDQEKELFANLRAQAWWYVRTLFETGQIDIDIEDDDLAAELASIQFKRTSTGKIQIESKADAMKRGVRSPNRADALMLAVMPDEPTDGGYAAVW